ncbi:MAG: AAA family ATPase [Myxococcales bacterium]|nr:AAA family ATPase [Myxococcales bacterium]
MSESLKDPVVSDDDPEMQRIVAEEQRVLSRVLKHLAARKLRRTGRIDYDDDLIALRDEIGEARLEDVPALVAQMERLQQVAARRADVSEGDVDVASPYFGRIVLQEGERKREVLIGRTTYLDSKTGVQIVDWRDAPVSRVYYRYDEGDDYDEQFGGRMVEGEVITRRSLAIADSQLRRVGAVQGTFLLRHDGGWVRLGDSTVLKGGQGAAPRPSDYKPVGRLGVSHDGVIREDKHLPEIAALIDARQFELITKPDSGLVVIQGGAGSGKTTIGLHRMAYLAFQDRRRFKPERMLVIVFNSALSRYIAHVLPALGVSGVPVATFHSWARKLRTGLLRDLPGHYTDETPDVVVRLKKHPAWLGIIDDHVAAEVKAFEAAVRKLGNGAGAEIERVLAAFGERPGSALAQRARRLLQFLEQEAGLGASLRHGIERELQALLSRTDPVGLWSELLTDREALARGFARHAPGEFTEGQLGAVFRWCSKRCAAAITHVEEREERRAERAAGELDKPEHHVGIDGVEETHAAALDWEDDALLLRMLQRLRGPLRQKRETLRYEHVFVDEAQDLSPLEIAVVLGVVRSGSVTLAGDVAQRLFMDNGFTGWDAALSRLGLAHIEVEPLRITYRSTREIIGFANEVLGPLQNEEPGQAMRGGVPVELFRFSHTGDAVGFLAESLRALLASEPMASVAVITRTLEQAREYADGLTRAEVPYVRLIAEQDFPFKAGIDVTDVRQVKGLEFDYVILPEVTAESFPDTEESRHLLHIAATRAAHQLWITTTDKPSPLLPEDLCERGY